jgi:hypothetical protein
MKDYLFRPSSVGKLMTEPKTKSEGNLSAGAKTYIREIAAQYIFGVDFEIASKYLDKGIICEQDSIDLLNNVRGLSLIKNTERKTNEYLNGECDLFDVSRNIGHDIKTSWSLQTFPILERDCHDKLYEWQMRSYMMLWDANEWEVNYCMVNTPEDLIKFEPLALHVVDHIPKEHRVTTWVIQRDKEKEEMMKEKIIFAREYMQQVFEEFDSTHQALTF